jgi:hypothetical protein
VTPRLLAAFADAIFRFDQRNEFLQKEIAVANPPIGGVDVETFAHLQERAIRNSPILYVGGEDRRAASIRRC